jgi:hypothetical protein
MDLFRKAFLFSVGLVAVTIEEAEKLIEKTIKAIEEQRDELADRFTGQHA